MAVAAALGGQSAEPGAAAGVAAEPASAVEAPVSLFAAPDAAEAAVQGEAVQEALASLPAALVVVVMLTAATGVAAQPGESAAAAQPAEQGW